MKITNLFRMSSDKGRTCAFTGHRPQNLPFRFNENDDRCIALKQKLRDCIVQLIEQEGVRHFISGMATSAHHCAAAKCFGQLHSCLAGRSETAVKVDLAVIHNHFSAFRTVVFLIGFHAYCPEGSHPGAVPRPAPTGPMPDSEGSGQGLFV